MTQAQARKTDTGGEGEPTIPHNYIWPQKCLSLRPMLTVKQFFDKENDREKKNTKQFFVRSIEPVKELACFDYMKWIQGRGPFTFQDEYAFFQEHSIDCLVAKNSGGYASHPKITVARVLGIPVVL